MSLQGKVVVITGAARGVGRYVAGSFAREGCRLAIPEIDAERMTATAAELRAMGAEVLTATVDVTDEPAVSAFMDRVRDHYGQLDILVNNAAIVSHRHWGMDCPPVCDMEWGFLEARDRYERRRRLPVHQARAAAYARDRWRSCAEYMGRLQPAGGRQSRKHWRGRIFSIKGRRSQIHPVSGRGGARGGHLHPYCQPWWSNRKRGCSGRCQSALPGPELIANR